ncbi:hypothetical protein LZG00_14060 [Rhodobacteraceae bacterium LMO-12]|nr:hypothetical protein [Rhodobacteraceae bacterium LMO-JJ12]
MAIEISNQRVRFAQLLSAFLRRASYGSKAAELILYILAVSGLMLWTEFDLPWQMQRTTLAAHMVISLVLFPLFVLPFWLGHREILARSNKTFLRRTGVIIEYSLLMTTLSGVYLVFFGNRGNLAGQFAYWAHLLPALPMTLLILRHALRWSLLKSLKWATALMLALIALTGAGLAAEESGSLAGHEGVLFSANNVAGSVSWVDQKTGTRLGEMQIGGDLRRLALGKDGLLAVTDSAGGRVVFVDWKKQEIVKDIAVGLRPVGIVYDRRNDLFWTALFEAHELVAVHPDNGVLYRIPSEETPRGLALLSDGRLLVSHAMVGKVSIHDTTTRPPRMIATIDMAETQDKDEFVSQGVPRLLDDIAVSPDERQAWLPHVLWNFDHLFQFQSTIFPAISVLSLSPGHEAEQVEQRKQLFQQINLRDPVQTRFDGSPKTIIVSNPLDAQFSKDGTRVYVTMAGSEDLVTFESNGVGNAIQILRHLPGTNPRGLVVSEEEAFVQNAMSLDLTRLSLNGEPRVDQARFANLVASDPIAPALRRGMILFHAGNTDHPKDFPMTGDYWMSCQSCHVDGFNFTNSYLFEDTKIDKYRYARVGHGNLGSMIAGNFVGDYIQIVQGTQGGLGHDGEGSAPYVDSEDPPAEVAEMMVDLHEFVTAKGNLPLVSSWLRLDDDRGTVHESEWTNSAACAECHSDMFDQWADSLHRLMGDSNPYYKVTEDIAAAEEGEEFRTWCMGCHHPQGLLSGLTATSNNGHMFEQGGTSLFDALGKGVPDLDEGTGCLFCHRITKLENALGKTAGANASFTVNIKDRETYVFENSQQEILNWLGNHGINAKPEAHATSYSQDFYSDSKLSSSCHNEFAPGTGALIVDTYSEWERSSYNVPEKPDQHRSCIDCHMHADVSRIGEDIPGVSTDGGRVKKNVVTHQFTGANYRLVGLRNPELERMTVELLRTAAKLDISLTEAGKLNARVRNTGAGHALPTGVADFRQVWLDVTVTDATGQVVLESGKMDEAGVVDHDARFFRKVFGDRYGDPVGFRFWRYERMIEDTKIPANGHRDEVFDLPANTTLPLTATVRLMFRTYPQFVTDLVQEQYPELPDPEPVLMTQQTVELPQ